MQNPKTIFLKAILSKKELASVDLNYAKYELEAFLVRDSKAKKYLESGKISERSKEFKQIVKAVRSVLRRAHSLFEVGDRSEEYLRFHEEIGEVKTWKKLVELSEAVLASHASSNERKEDYKELYTWLAKKVKPLNSIIDLGCGLHPFSVVFLGKKKLKGMNYLAFDINNSEKDLLDLFFDKTAGFFEGFYGKADVMNLRNKQSQKRLKSLDNCDLAFMLKLTDHLDRGQGHKATEEILVSLNSKYVLLSFPTITRSGAPMRFPKRKWVKYLCNRLNYGIEIFETKNELFYLINKC
ncbi:hypothetical protein CL619_03275 [archaeon]|nr:hypothetical protein [archaeon]|tara:strand:+ start:675 stop:1562 length:888 start_codon:yes stop_codon:yes gene_type:complete